MNNTAKRISLTGAFAALVVVLGITKLGMIPLGPTASITILHVPVILICMLSGLWEGCVVGAAFGIMSLIQAAMSPSGVLDPMFTNPLVSVLPRVLLAVAAWALWKGLKWSFEKISKYKVFFRILMTVIAGVVAWIAVWTVVKGNEAIPYEWKINYTLIGIACAGALVWNLVKSLPDVTNGATAGVAAFLATLVHTVMVIGSLYLFQPGVKEAMGGAGYGAVMVMLLPQACLEATGAAIVCVAVMGAVQGTDSKKSKLSAEADE